MNNKTKNKIMYWILLLMVLSSIVYTVIICILISFEHPEFFAGMLMTLVFINYLIFILYLLAKIGGLKGLIIEVD